MTATPPRVAFRAELERNGTTATGMEVPAAALDQLGAGKRPPVVVTVEGHSFRTTLGSVDGRPMVPVSGATREAAGISAGNVYDVVVEVDTAPRELAVPPELQSVLESDAALAAAYSALSRSRRRQLVDPIAAAKGADTRSRRVAKAVAALNELRRDRD